MKAKKGPLSGIGYELRTMANRTRIIEYDVMMGIISSSLLCVFEILSYFFIPDSSIRFKEIYLINGIVMGIQFFLIAAIYHNGYVPKNAFFKSFLVIHPYLIVLIGIDITYFSFGLTDRVLSFVIALFTASLVQIYSLPRRIFLFTFSFWAFILMMASITPTNSMAFLEALRNSIMISIVGLFYTMIQYQSTTNRIAVWNTLKEEDSRKTESMTELKKVNQQLESSHRITGAMLRITAEILNTDHLDDVLQLLLDQAIQLTPSAQAGSILTLEGEHMQYRAARGYDLEKLKTISLKFSDLFQSKQTDFYEPAIIKNLETFDSTNLTPEVYSQFQKHRALVAKAVLTCSFKYEGKFFGSINLDNFESEDAYNSADIELIRHLAAQLEITIGIHKLYEKALRPTKYDDLTQACTRKYYREQFEKTITLSKTSKLPFAMVVMDINHFKEINDRFGHEIGDDCLAYFAQSVRDGSPKSAILARIGGDEFSMLLPDTSLEDAKQKLMEIHVHLESHPFLVLGKKEAVTFASGVAMYPEDGQAFDTLFREADRRMYVEKNHKSGTTHQM